MSAHISILAVEYYLPVTLLVKLANFLIHWNESKRVNYRFSHPFFSPRFFSAFLWDEKKSKLLFSNDAYAIEPLNSRSMSSQSWYRSARFENEVQNENYKKVRKVAKKAVWHFPSLKILRPYYNCPKLSFMSCQILATEWKMSELLLI